MHVTQVHEAQVIKCHYRSLKRHYRSLKRHYKVQEFFFKLNFEKIEFQKRDISLISLEKRAKCWVVFLKRVKTNFVHDIIKYLQKYFQGRIEKKAWG